MKAIPQTMRIKTDTPEIALLRGEVCARAGFTPHVHAEFANLAAAIEQGQRSHISATTLERLWNYSTRGYKTVYEHTLDMLCQYVGDDSWQAFLRRSWAEGNAQVVLGAPGASGALNASVQPGPTEVCPEAIIPADLEIGTVLRIRWRPDRICEMRYIGDSRFVCCFSQNTHIQPGDSFCCRRISAGEPLRMDGFVRAADSELSYTIGHKNGLTGVEVVE